MKKKLLPIVSILTGILFGCIQPSSVKTGENKNPATGSSEVNTQPNAIGIAESIYESRVTFEESVLMQNDYKKDDKRLVFKDGINKNMPVEGFRINKDSLLALFDANPEGKDLYIFLAMVDDHTKYDKANPKDFTVIFGTASNGEFVEGGKTYYGNIQKNRFYEYVRPCPPYCPKFK